MTLFTKCAKVKVIESHSFTLLHSYTPQMPLTRDLYMEERRQEILRRLESAGRVSVTELSQAFGVSEVTIRSDLQALAEQKLAVRTHGGAVLQDLALSSRQQQQMQENRDSRLFLIYWL